MAHICNERDLGETDGRGRPVLTCIGCAEEEIRTLEIVTGPAQFLRINPDTGATRELTREEMLTKSRARLARLKAVP